ncbi:uncharacterized protein V1518DRAFT_423614 [Limtongia smithiae]|uniref:uncharacterized protein n=1 Tax=Limtongia smithiae TaxID=1125753 RepID=UPI0034CF2E42
MSDPRINSVQIPYGYVTPDFPSLHWPSGQTMETLYYLYYRKDIWRFTLYWTMIMYAVVHLVAGSWAMTMTRRVKGGVFIMFTYLAIAVLEGFISGSIVGAILGLIYSAGSFTMSTWIPFVWAVIQIFIIIMTGYSMSAMVM